MEDNQAQTTSSEAAANATLEKELPPVEYKNDNVAVAVYRKPACRIEMKVKAFAAIAQEAKKRALHAVVKAVALPGFRKGKAPEELVAKKYGSEVDREWQQTLANALYRESQLLAQVPLLDPSASKVSYKLESYSLDGAELLISFETTPTPPIVNPQELAIKMENEIAVDDAKIDEAIHQIRFYFAEWKNAQERAVQDGDYVLLDIDDLEATPPTTVFSSVRFEVSDARMAKWMRELVIGMKVGESRDGTSQPDDSATEKEKEEIKPKKVRITLKAVEEANLPPIDDEFAKKVGSSSVQEMRDSIRSILQSQVTDQNKKALREQLDQQLLEKYPFDLPTSLIDKEARFRMEQLGRDQQFVQYWNERDDAGKQVIVKQIYEQSEKAVRMFYLCRKVVADAQIKITTDDLPPPRTSPLEIMLSSRSDNLFNQNSKLGHAEAYSRLVMEKAEDYLISLATKI